jgi:hypothetical protein
MTDEEKEGKRRADALLDVACVSMCVCVCVREGRKKEDRIERGSVFKRAQDTAFLSFLTCPASPLVESL